MKEKIKQVIVLSIPAILAELSSTLMQYIDSAMVGSLGAQASASIGLVASTTWLINGIGIAVASGFSVQVAQSIGAQKKEEAKTIMRIGRKTITVFALIMSLFGFLIHQRLPIWLGGQQEVTRLASQYFGVFALSLFFSYNRMFAGSVLQCAGDMKTPSLLNIGLCLFDVLFNAVLIFGFSFGVLGAALGTALSEVLISLFMMKAMNRHFRSYAFDEKLPKKIVLQQARAIGIPIALEHSVLNLAQILLVRIVSPLGTVAVAANALAISAESICYMPGFGIASAATTLVGQSLGAKKVAQAKQFAYVSVFVGIGLMSFMGVLMYIGAPYLFQMLSSETKVRTLGVSVLRIEAFAEPFYAASIVAGGALRGAKDTLVPSLYNLVSMWGIRIVLALYLAPILGLKGVWLAMAIELTVRGLLFLYRLDKKNWNQAIEKT